MCTIWSGAVGDGCTKRWQGRVELHACCSSQFISVRRAALFQAFGVASVRLRSWLFTGVAVRTAVTTAEMPFTICGLQSRSLAYVCIYRRPLSAENGAVC